MHYCIVDMLPGLSYASPSLPLVGMEIGMAQQMTVGAKAVSNSGGYKRIVYIICAVAALGGLLFGLDQGFIANSLATIDAHYQLGIQGGERYSAILATGGIIGALLSGIFARFLGRKKSLLLAGFIFTAGSALSALLPPLPVLSACRFALGFAVGVASFIVPLYLAETAPASIRGRPRAQAAEEAVPTVLTLQ